MVISAWQVINNHTDSMAITAYPKIWSCLTTKRIYKSQKDIKNIFSIIHVKGMILLGFHTSSFLL